MNESRALLLKCYIAYATRFQGKPTMVSLEDPSFTHCNRETRAVHGTGSQVGTPLADGIRQVTSADHRDLRGGRGCSSYTASVGADSIRPLFLMGISSGGKMHLRVKAQCPFLLRTVGRLLAAAASSFTRAIKSVRHGRTKVLPYIRSYQPLHTRRDAPCGCPLCRSNELHSYELLIAAPTGWG